MQHEHAFYAMPECTCCWIPGLCCGMMFGWRGVDDPYTGTASLDGALRRRAASGLQNSAIPLARVFRSRGGKSGSCLAGHTHGGQVRPPFLPPLFLPKGCWPMWPDGTTRKEQLEVVRESRDGHIDASDPLQEPSGSNNNHGSSQRQSAPANCSGGSVTSGKRRGSPWNPRDFAFFQQQRRRHDRTRNPACADPKARAPSRRIPPRIFQIMKTVPSLPTPRDSESSAAYNPFGNPPRTNSSCRPKRTRDTAPAAIARRSKFHLPSPPIVELKSSCRTDEIAGLSMRRTSMHHSWPSSLHMRKEFLLQIRGAASRHWIRRIKLLGSACVSESRAERAWPFEA